MKNYAVLIMAMLPIVDICAGGETTQESRKTVLSLQEQVVQQMGKRAVTDLLREEDARSCNTLKEFLASNRDINPDTKKELEKYRALCDLFKALNGIANNELKQFEIADKIINTQVGQGPDYLIDPNTIIVHDWLPSAIANKSLLAIILEKANKTRDLAAFQRLLLLAQMLLTKNPTIGQYENRVMGKPLNEQIAEQVAQQILQEYKKSNPKLYKNNPQYVTLQARKEACKKQLKDYLQ